MIRRAVAMQTLPRATIAILALSLPAFAADAPVVTVFGLPLGGSLPKLPLCRSIDGPVTAICHAAATNTTTGKAAAKSAVVRIPTNSAPVWAGESPMLHLDIIGGLIASMKIEAFYVDPGTVNASLSKRFGLPSSHFANAQAVRDQWHLPDLDIDLFCIREDARARCVVTFRSAADAASLRNEIAERDRRNAQRPASP